MILLHGHSSLASVLFGELLIHLDNPNHAQYEHCEEDQAAYEDNNFDGSLEQHLPCSTRKYQIPFVQLLIVGQSLPW